MEKLRKLFNKMVEKLGKWPSWHNVKADIAICLNFGLILRNLQTKNAKNLEEFNELTNETYPDGKIFKYGPDVSSRFPRNPGSGNQNQGIINPNSGNQNQGNPNSGNPNAPRPLCVGLSTGTIVSDTPPPQSYVCFLCKNKFQIAHWHKECPHHQHNGGSGTYNAQLVISNQTKQAFAQKNRANKFEIN
jgi:hypothetical protein